MARLHQNGPKCCDSDVTQQCSRTQKETTYTRGSQSALELLTSLMLSVFALMYGVTLQRGEKVDCRNGVPGLLQSPKQKGSRR